MEGDEFKSSVAHAELYWLSSHCPCEEPCGNTIGGRACLWEGTTGIGDTKDWWLGEGEGEEYSFRYAKQSVSMGEGSLEGDAGGAVVSSEEESLILVIYVTS